MGDNLSSKTGARSRLIRSEEVALLLEQARGGDFQSLARVLTWIERSGPDAVFKETALLNPQHQAFRVGITGPPGAGKSTLIGQIIGSLRQRGLKVGVLAVDPSSPFSQGAILGDRIRYSDHFNDAQVFIRSLGTRGSLGGLSAAAYLMLRAFDAAQFDIVLVETVGVGQTELEIINVADFVSVVLVPESGDSIQAMKAGLTEIADLFVINKSDRPGAEGLKNELRATLELGENRKAVQILSTVATEQKGIDDFVDHLVHAKSQFDRGLDGGQALRNSEERLRAEGKALLRWVTDVETDRALQGLKSSSDLASRLEQLRLRLEKR